MAMTKNGYRFDFNLNRLSERLNITDNLYLYIITSETRVRDQFFYNVY